jgi:hypothetical protein
MKSEFESSEAATKKRSENTSEKTSWTEFQSLLYVTGNEGTFRPRACREVGKEETKR